MPEGRIAGLELAAGGEVEFNHSPVGQVQQGTQPVYGFDLLHDAVDNLGAGVELAGEVLQDGFGELDVRILPQVPDADFLGSAAAFLGGFLLLAEDVGTRELDFGRGRGAAFPQQGDPRAGQGERVSAGRTLHDGMCPPVVYSSHVDLYAGFRCAVRQRIVPKRFVLRLDGEHLDIAGGAEPQDSNRAADALGGELIRPEHRRAAEPFFAGRGKDEVCVPDAGLVAAAFALVSICVHRIDADLYAGAVLNELIVGKPPGVLDSDPGHAGHNRDGREDEVQPRDVVPQREPLAASGQFSRRGPRGGRGEHLGGGFGFRRFVGHVFHAKADGYGLRKLIEKTIGLPRDGTLCSVY